MMRLLWLGLFLAGLAVSLILASPAMAKGIDPQINFQVGLSSVTGIARDAIGNVYVLGIPAAGGTAKVRVFSTPSLDLLFEFDTGLFETYAFKVDDAGVTTVVGDRDDISVNFKRFDNTGVFLSSANLVSNDSLWGVAYSTYMTSMGAKMLDSVTIRDDRQIFVNWVRLQGSGGFCFSQPCGTTSPPWWHSWLHEYDATGNLVDNYTYEMATEWEQQNCALAQFPVVIGDHYYRASATCPYIYKYKLDPAAYTAAQVARWDTVAGNVRGMWVGASLRSLFAPEQFCEGGTCSDGIVKTDLEGAFMAGGKVAGSIGAAWDGRIIYHTGSSPSEISQSVVNDSPGQPVLVSPIGPVSQHLREATLRWGHSSDLDGDPLVYEVFLGTDSADLSLVVTTPYPFQGVETPALAFGTTYYWKVRAVDSYLGLRVSGSDSAIMPFVLSLVNSPPGDFSVLSGTGTVVTRDASVQLAWEPAADPDGDGVTYAVPWSFGAEAAVLTTTGTSLRFTGLTFGATYFWSARAYDLYGAESLLDGGRHQSYHPVFKNSAPEMPGTYTSGDQLYEVHGETTTVILSWAAAPDVDKDPVEYAVYLGESPESLVLVSTQSGRSYAVGPLDVGTGFYWRVRATDPYGAFTDGKIGRASTIFVNDPPKTFSVIAGTGVFVTRTAARELVWDSAADPDGDAVGYELHFSSDVAALAVVHTGPETRWTMSALTFGTTYYWSVLARDAYDGLTAHNGGVESLRLEFRNAPPAAPSVLAGAGVSTQHATAPELRLTWSAVADPDGDAVAYRLHFGTDRTSLPEVLDSTATHYDVPEPSFGTTYYWRVAAYDPYGAEAATAVQETRIDIQNEPPGAFSAISGAGAVETRETSWTLAWSAAFDPDGDPVTYELALSTDPAGLVTVRVSTATSFELSFEYGTDYYWRVTARDDFGGERALPVQAFSPAFENSAPSAPDILGGSGILFQHTTSPSARLEWSASWDLDGDPVGYRVSVGTGPAHMSLVRDSTATAHTLADPLYGTTYYWQVTAYDPYGGETSTGVQELRLELQNAAPGQFSATSGVGDLATRETAWPLAWTAALDADGDAVAYELAVASGAGLFQTVQGSSARVYDLAFSFGVEYAWTVTARDDFGGETVLAVQSFRPTFYNTPPPVPGILAGAGVSAQHTYSPSAELAWSAVTDAESDMVSYRLELGTAPEALAVVYDNSDTRYALPSPAQGSTHYWRVTAHDEYGAGSSTAVQELRLVLANEPPREFSVLTGAGDLITRSTTTELSWSEALDPDVDIVTYELRLGTAAGTLAAVQDSEARSYSLSFEIGQTFYWTVTARDSFGGERALPVQTLRTQFRNSAPTAPVLQTRTGIIPHHGFTPSLALFWEPSTDPDGDPLYYRLLYGTDSNSLLDIGEISLGHELDGMSVEKAYYFQLVAVDSFGARTAGDVQWVYFDFVNSAPGAFDATGGVGEFITRATTMTLSWTPSADLDGDPVTYRVLFGTATAALAPVGDFKETSAPLEGLAFGASYFWTVDAFDGFGATTTIQGGVKRFRLTFKNSPPPAPQVLAGSGLDFQHTLQPEAGLSWSAVSDPDGDVVAYRVSVGSDPDQLSSVQDSAATTYDLQNPTFGTTYYWRVDAYDPYGGEASTGLQELRLELQNAAPGQFSATSGVGDLTTRETVWPLAWTAALDADGDAVTYELAVASGAGTFQTVQVSSARVYDLAFTFGAEYAWTVIARDGFGGETALAAQSFRPTFYNTPPPAPGVLAGAGVSAQHTFTPAAELVWSTVTDAENDMVSYRLELGASPEDLVMVQVGTATSFSLASPEQGSTHYWRVSAVDAYGAGSTTTIQELRLALANEPPGVFTVLSGAGPVSTRETSWTLSWSVAADLDGDLVTYELALSTDPAGLATVQVLTATSFDLPFEYGTDYYWRVTARDGFGGECTLPVQTFSPAFENSAPDTPVILSGSGVSAQHTFTPSAELEWGEVFDADGDAVGYRLELGTAPESMAAVQDGPPTSYALPLPAQGTTHYWRVSAYDEYGAASTSGIQELHLELQNAPPGSLAALSGTGALVTRTTSTTLAWSSAHDADGDPIFYTLRVGTAPETMAVVREGSATSYRLAFEYDTTYYWSVAARDGFGGSSLLSPQSLSPSFLNSPPSAPTNQSQTGIVAFHGFSPELALFWSSSFDPDGDAVSYSVRIGTEASSLQAVDHISLGHRLKALRLDTAYFYEIVATDAYGARSSSGLDWVFFEFTNTAPEPFSKSAGAGRFVTRTTTMTLAWSTAADLDGDPVAYQVLAGTAAGSLDVVETLDERSAVLAGLDFDTTYYWSVRAFDGFGGTRTLTGAPFAFFLEFLNNSPPAPASTSGVGLFRQHTLTPVAELAWTAVADPEGDPVAYRLFFGTALFGLAPVQDSASTSYTLASPALGATYYWRVEAYDIHGGFSSTPVFDHRIELSNAPPAVFSPTSGAGEVATREPAWMLAWTEAADPDGDKVSYELTVSTDPSALAMVWTSTATSYLLPIVHGTTYYWDVRAFDPLGGERRLGPQTMPVRWRNSPPAAARISDGSGVFFQHTLTPSARLAWSTPADPDGDPVRHRLFLGPAATDLMPVQDSSATQHPIPAPIFGATYYWQVESYDPYGGTVATEIQSLRVELANAAPGSFSAVFGVGNLATRETQWTLAWSAASDLDGDPVAYELEIATETAEFLSVQSGSTTVYALSFVYGATYYWRVTARDGFGGETRLPRQTFRPTFYNTAPPAPAIMSGAGVSFQHTFTPSAELAWGEVFDAEGDAVGYRLELGTAPENMAAVQEGDGTSYALPTPGQGTTHYWRVIAHDEYGAASSSGVQELHLELQNTPPGSFAAVSGAGPVSTRKTSWTLAWSEAVDPDGDALVYELRLSTNPAALAVVRASTAASFRFPFEYGVDYYWQVTARDPFGGERTPPAWTFSPTFKNSPPAIPAALDGVGVAFQHTHTPQARLEWSAAADPDGDAVGYRLYLGTTPSALPEVQESSATVYDFPEPLFGTTYYWEVVAYDPYGAAGSTSRQELRLELQNDPPNAFSALAGTGLVHTRDTLLDLEWSSASDPDDDPVLYELKLSTDPAALAVVRVSTDTHYRLPIGYETDYYWRVTAQDPFGGERTLPVQTLSPAFKNSPPAIPAALDGVGVVFQHTHTPQARLEWSAAGDPDEDLVAYRLSVGTDSARMALVRDSTETVYDLPAPLFGTTYYWEVTAYDPYGGEAATDVHDIRIELKNGAPGPFAAVSGTGTVPTRETAWALAWSDALDPDGDAVTYELELATNPAGLARVQLSTATRYDLPFEYGTDYYWRVTARDGFGGERVSPVWTFSPVFRNAEPGVPANLTKTGTIPFHGRSPALSFFWERSTDPNGDAVAYHLHFGTDSERLAGLGVVDLGHTLENLAADKAYYYSIVAVDRYGARSASPVHWVFFEYSNLPPGTFEIMAGSGTIVTRATSAGLSWTAAEDPDGDPVTYRVLVGTQAADLRLLTETRQTSAVLRDIVFGTTYYWNVVAFDTLGRTSTLRNGPQSLVHLFSNGAPDRPAITSALGPIAFHAKAPAYSLAWEGGSDPEGDPVTFEVAFGTQPTASDGIELPAGTRRYEPRDLTADTTYYVRVSARDGYGAISAAAAGALLFEFVNDAPTPPRYTEGLGAQRQRTLTPGVTVAWETSFDADGDPVRYALYFSTRPDSAVPAVDTTQTSAFIGGLAVGATYYWRVAAYDPYARTWGEQASVVVTLENGAPRPIRYLSPVSTRTRETAFLIRWEDSGDPDGEPVRYTLGLGSGEDALAEVSLTSPKSYALPIRYGTTYYYRVSAIDAFGSRTMGDTRSLTVEFLNDPPEPIALVAPFMEQPNIATMNGGVELTWRLVSNPQGDPITYEVHLWESPGELDVVARVAFDGSQYRLAGFGTAQVHVRPRLAVEGDRVRLHLEGLEYYRSYYLKVVASNEFGAKSETDMQRFTIQAADGFPAAYNYPNPFNPLRGGTNIVFNAPAGGFHGAVVSVYSEMQDLLFRREYAGIPPGVSEVKFDGRDRFGRALFNGSYICRVRFEGPDHEEVFYLLVVK